MAYCKFCGMDSKDPAKCEWCGKPLGQGVSTPRAPSPPPPDARPTTWEIVEREEAEDRRSRLMFFLVCGGLVVFSAVVISVRASLFPWVILGSLFAAGMLLGALRVIPAFEDEWTEVGIPFVLALIFPAFFVCLGYLAYGFISRSMNYPIIWLLSVYLIVLTFLEIVTIIALSSSAGGVSMDALWKLRGVEILSLITVLFGWIASGSVRPRHKF